MKAYEYEGKVLTDGHLSIPEDLKEKLNLNIAKKI
jgi:hypothetical protein